MSYYGYKNHVSTDRRYKLVRRWAVTDASVHDSQVIEKILDPDNTAAKVWADKAYRSAEIEEVLEELGYRSMIMRKGSRGRKLTKREKQGNGTKAKVRARVEHVFGAQANDMGGTMLRSIGAMRARAHIGAEEPGIQHAEAHPPGKRGRGRSLALKQASRAQGASFGCASWHKANLEAAQRTMSQVSRDEMAC